MYIVYNIVEEHFSISIVPVRSRGGSVVYKKYILFFKYLYSTLI
jgi:hypothetical protein